MSWRSFGLWVGLSALLNLAWEIAQLPLYALYREATAAQIAYAIAHCTVGDLLIAAVAYAVASLASGTTAWPFRKPLFGIVLVVVVTVSYTAFSEWLNVYVRGSWAYSDLMPQLFGIGLSPLLQWIAVPIAATFASRMVGFASFRSGH